MAVELPLLVWPAVAGADLSTKQYTVVKINSSGQLVAAVAGDRGWLLQDKPKSGQTGTIALAGVSKGILAGSVAAGDYLSADANGKLVKATDTNVGGSTTGTHIVGQALAAGVSGDLIPVNAAIGLS